VDYKVSIGGVCCNRKLNFFTQALLEIRQAPTRFYPTLDNLLNDAYILHMAESMQGNSFSFARLK
jgi:hypothetical protein